MRPPLFATDRMGVHHTFTEIFAQNLAELSRLEQESLADRIVFVDQADLRQDPQRCLNRYSTELNTARPRAANIESPEAAFGQYPSAQHCRAELCKIAKSRFA